MTKPLPNLHKAARRWPMGFTTVIRSALGCDLPRAAGTRNRRCPRAVIRSLLGVSGGIVLGTVTWHGQAQPPPVSGGSALATGSVATPPAPSGTGQAPQPPSANAVAIPADVVMLKNGGMLRGTIVELVPGSFVSVLLPTGETRKVAMAEVEYAGLASEMPRKKKTDVPLAPPAPPPPPVAPAPSPVRPAEQARPAVPVKPPDVRIHLDAKQSNLTYYVEERSPGDLVRLCTAPCDVLLPAGTYVFAIAGPDGRVTKVGDPIRIEGEGGLVATHESEKPWRTAGWFTLGVGQAVGLGMIAGAATTGFQKCEDTPTYFPGSAVEGSVHRCDWNETSRVLLITGLLTMGATLAIGLPLGLSRDKVAIVPGGPIAPSGTRPATAMELYLDTLSGASLVGRF